METELALSNPHVEYRADRLYCEELALDSLAAEQGTPLYVYSRRTLIENFDRFSRALANLPSDICYSVKANSNISILKTLASAGSGFDIVSGGELERVRRAGADPARVVFSGVGKTEAEIDAALSAGIMMFNVESEGELGVIQSRARRLNRRAPISIRVNPDVEAHTHPYISTGQAVHKFGVPKDEALTLYRRAAATAELEIRGVACHIGSQILDAGPFLEAFDEIKALADLLTAEGTSVQYLDLGGGFGIRYSSEAALNPDAVAAALAPRLHDTPYRLVVEPGRAIVGNAGLLLTRVVYVKQNPQKNFIVVDAGMNDLLRPALYGSFHEIAPVRRKNGEPRVADVVGPICETGDFLARDRELPLPAPGDLLAVLATGAYGYSLASNYNTRPRPAEVLVHRSHAELIRSRETLDALLDSERF